ncbi:hypothetical protein [Rufibacter tibetensis]|uniref:Uncharacterized protein n=1 Tax=Rufibacter tibetensis TaxID=512763 RepID=A0A0P0CAQ6_9BACT|nr:hypothetical protein [Rufibacter tibetensis]ALJ00726.1 hypothetical protein DC20_19265 [Rufibacter tibetensis]
MNIRITIAFILVIANILFAHSFAPTGMMLTPVLLIIVTTLVCFKVTSINPIPLSLITYGLIALHDIGIKLYSGGSHDSQGLGWVHLLLFLGLVPSYVILVNSIFKDKELNRIEKLTAVFLFPVLIAGHLLLFGDLGLGLYYDI